MTTSQLTQLGMFKSVHQFCLRKQAMIETLPAFVSGLNTLGHMITALECMDCLFTLRPGETDRETNRIRVALSRITLATANTTFLYAENTQEEELQEELSAAILLLKTAPVEQLPDIARTLFMKVHPLAPKLAVYGITSGVFNAWNHLLNAYTPNLRSPRAAMMQRQQMQLCFSQLFQNATVLCSDFLDPLAEKCKKKDPEFWAEYQRMRESVNKPIKGAHISGTVKSKADGQPIAKATVTLVENGIVVKTDNDGAFLFRAVKKGRYTLRAGTDNYFTKTAAPFDLKDGEQLQVDFELSPEEVLQN